MAPLVAPPRVDRVAARPVTDPVSPLAAVIALVPALADRLMAEHVDDGTGRCRLCPLGDQAGHQLWPCRIHSAAAASRSRPRRPI